MKAAKKKHQKTSIPFENLKTCKKNNKTKQKSKQNQ